MSQAARPEGPPHGNDAHDRHRRAHHHHRDVHHIHVHGADLRQQGQIRGRRQPGTSRAGEFLLVLIFNQANTSFKRTFK